MRSWDAIIVGAGIIGLSLAISLRKHGLHVLVVERGEPGREASSAAAGMLVGSGDETPLALAGLAQQSADLYPEFVHELEDESGIKIDLRDQGTILLSRHGHFPDTAQPISPRELQSVEPSLSPFPAKQEGAKPVPGTRPDSRISPHSRNEFAIAYLSERSVDPRALVSAAIKAARHRGVDISSGTKVKNLLISGGRVTGVETDKTSYCAGIVVNCAGAWAGCIAPEKFPVRPVKGQMLAVVGGPALKHVVRGEEVYLVPRSDGRVIIGSTLENAGYNKQVDVNTIQQLSQAALELVPGLSKSKKHEDWAGLRPGTPDELPILGETSTGGYFVASGHYRDGILLAPVTAQVMTELLMTGKSSRNIAAFFSGRFENL